MSSTLTKSLISSEALQARSCSILQSLRSNEGRVWWIIKAERVRGRLEDVCGFIGGLYRPDLHAKRIDALASASLVMMAGASLAVAMIGQALAQGLVTKHAVKQVDRLMSNGGIDVRDSSACWVPHQVGAYRDILVAMDRTDFDHDDQSTLVLSLVTGHGRAPPLIWLSVWKEEIATRRNDYEDACLRRLTETMPSGCRVTILATTASATRSRRAAEVASAISAIRRALELGRQKYVHLP